LGFKSAELEEASAHPDLGSPRLAKVVYGLGPAVEVIDDAMHKIAPEPTGHPGVHGYYEVRWNALPALATIKHPSFTEEQEWRLLVAGEGEGVEFRISSLGIVPYVVFKLVPGWLSEVVVGPGVHTDVRAKGVKQLLKVHGYRDVAVRESEAPLRS
jgi:hypothetical protein